MKIQRLIAGLLAACLLMTEASADEDQTEPPNQIGESRDEQADVLIDGSPFAHEFDMNGDYTKYLLQVKNARVWNEIPNGLAVRYWAPARTGVTGEIVYSYRFKRRVKSAYIACNLLPHRQDDEVLLEVAGDDGQFHVVTDQRQHPQTDPPFALTQHNLSRVVHGSKAIQIRVKLKGTQLNTSIMSSQFLRTADSITCFNSPYVYRFLAELE